MKINETVTKFCVKDQNGNEINSENLMGKKWVLYFYPKDMTPGCTQQACNIRDNYSLLKKHGIEIFGVSMDTAEKHQKFIEKYTLPFPLIVDTDKKLIDLFVTWGEKSFLGKVFNGILRKTFLINEENKIHYIIEKPKVKDHVQEILTHFGINS
ncbi:MAG: thioredoxin-dependent thiol peroxidase [Flavobacteriia bacterium]|nr:thioredoxin-dependent thiol peroxidase [Flavobacteriia bacterium]